MLLTDKTVIVSGVGAGLGREIALACAREGASVVLGARSEDNLQKVHDDIATEVGAEKVAWQRTDITSQDQTDGIVALAASRFGGLHGIVNCAAKDDVMGGILQTTDEQWRQTMEINLFGTMNLVRSAVPALELTRGSIVFIGSQTMLKPPPQMPQLAYAASKGALMAASYHLTQELGPKGIRVNTVVPSWMWGPPVEAYCNWIARDKGITVDEARLSLAKDFAMRDIAADDDVAQACTFFLSDKSSMVSGQSMLVNGGEYMR